MRLTIQELARAVSKSENYVRQHINRKHLAVQRDERRISVTLDEAARWARERGLPFVLPANAWPSTGAMKRRTARMTVLTQLRTGERHRNLLTIVRHRRQDALSPWSNEPEETWKSDDLGNGLRLYSIDASFVHCQALVDQILESATLPIDGVEIHYALEPIPRLCHCQALVDQILESATLPIDESRFTTPNQFPGVTGPFATNEGSPTPRCAARSRITVRRLSSTGALQRSPGDIG